MEGEGSGDRILTAEVDEVYQEKVSLFYSLRLEEWNLAALQDLQGKSKSI